VPVARSAATVAGITRAATASSELLLWKLWIPTALILAALVLGAVVLRSLRPRSATKQHGVSPEIVVPNPEKGKENYA
jgi:hypothetical protein